MQIIRRLESLRHREHTATVELIETLCTCHRTRAYADAGYGSIWQLLVRRLHDSPAAASRRNAAMRCALRVRWRAVFARDGHRCTFVAPDGTRCTSAHRLEVDHILPFAEGGTHEITNLRVLCRTGGRSTAVRHERKPAPAIPERALERLARSAERERRRANYSPCAPSAEAMTAAYWAS